MMTVPGVSTSHQARRFVCLFLVAICCLVATGDPALAQDTTPSAAWRETFCPYRVKIRLVRPALGRFEIDLTPEVLLDQLQTVSVDVTDINTLAFEKSVLVDRRTGNRIGGFKLVPVGTEMPIDGVIDTQSKDSAWTTYGSSPPTTISAVDSHGSPFDALWVTPDAIRNVGWKQRVALKPQSLYLLSYRIFSDPIDNNLFVSLVDPNRQVFADVHHSYFPKLPPQAQWTSRQVLFRPTISEADLRISGAFTGRCGVGDLHLQEVSFRLVADVPVATDEVDLYTVMRAGHRLPQPSSELMFSDSTGTPSATVESMALEAADLNPNSILVESDGVRAWTVANDLPLKTSLLEQTEPSASPADQPVVLQLARGTSQTVLLAVNTSSPRTVFGEIHSDLPLKVRVDGLAEIPVYDKSSPRGRLIETRLDAMTPLNFDLAPPSSTGIHTLALTFHADEHANPGRTTGSIAIEIKSPVATTLTVPVRTEILPIVVRPMQHFGTMFGGQHFSVRYSGGTFTEPSTTVTEFHGFTRSNPAVAPTGNTGGPMSVRQLAWKYFHRMLDFNVMPSTLPLHSQYKYKIVEQQGGLPPQLTDWDFTQYDKAIDEFLINRNATVWQVFHTNGALMDSFRLANGHTYSLKPADGRTTWHQLAPDAYFDLVGNFFEALAIHLEQKKVLDRAVIVIDESDPSTYPLIRQYVLQGLKTRPHAKQIRVAHTCYKTSGWTRRGADGKLMLDGVIDMPMPDNDDLSNCLEPEWNSRVSGTRQQWVYYVESDHLNLLNAGLSTIVTPLKLKHFGARGWYGWASFIWSMPFPHSDKPYSKFYGGPVINPWKNPHGHHGPGVLSFFYPPDPRGPSPEPVDRVIPSYRLSLMRDGIELRAFLEVLEAGVDDAGQPIDVDRQKLEAARQVLQELWAVNPVQWYLSYAHYRNARSLLFESARIR